MKHSYILFLLIFTLAISCKNKELSKPEIEEDLPEVDSAKLYQKISIVYEDEKNISEEYEVYVSKKNDSIWNQWKIYKNGVLDSSKSKFYNLNIEGNKNDSLLKGTISFYSPADSIPTAKISSREVTFIYLQRINDSLIFKEIKTDKNIIHFDYKDFDSLSFVGYISDLRFIEMDSVPEKLLLNRNFFAIDSEVFTNNNFVELLK